MDFQKQGWTGDGTGEGTGSGSSAMPSKGMFNPMPVYGIGYEDTPLVGIQQTPKKDYVEELDNLIARSFEKRTKGMFS